MTDTQEAPKMLRGFRVWIPLIIGLGVSAYLLYSSLNEVRFLEVGPDEVGTHTWIDANENGEVEHWLSEEFQAHHEGEYRKETISDIVQSIQWSRQSTLFLILAVLMIFVRDLGYIIRIRLLTEKKLSWYRSFIAIMMWEFASALSPGVVGGAAVAMFILNREGIPMGRATALVVITAFFDNLFFVLCVPLIALLVGHSVLFNDFSGDIAGSLVSLFWTGYGMIVLVSILLFVSLFFYPKLLKNILLTLAKLPFIRKYREKMAKTGDEIIITSQEFKGKEKGFWLSIFGATFLSWTGRYLVINMILAAFLSIGWYEHLVVLAKQFALWVIMLVSPTPGASGVAEWGFTALLGDFASSALLISSLAVLWRLISYFPYLFIGSLLMPRWLKKKKA
jgi:glycosyltransferase 2 family protein